MDSSSRKALYARPVRSMQGWRHTYEIRVCAATFVCRSTMRCSGAESRNVQRDEGCPSSARAVSFINQGQSDRECRTQPWTLARRADTATLPFDELFDDGQSEPEAGGGPGR
jgi:hypothetical protein